MERARQLATQTIEELLSAAEQRLSAAELLDRAGGEESQIIAAQEHAVNCLETACANLDILPADSSENRRFKERIKVMSARLPAKGYGELAERSRSLQRRFPSTGCIFVIAIAVVMLTMLSAATVYVVA